MPFPVKDGNATANMMTANDMVTDNNTMDNNNKQPSTR